MSAQRTYAGVSVGVRRAQRRATLVAVALELMATRGSSALNVRGVCGASRLNQRYFYESFSDRDELLEAAFDETRREATRAIQAAIAGTEGDLGAFARAATNTFMTLTRDPPHHGGCYSSRPRRNRRFAPVAPRS